LATAYAPARDSIEEQLVEMWRLYLGVRDIGVHDSFVALGGDSLMATRLHAHVEREFGVVLPIGKMLEAATIRRMGLHITVTRDPTAIDRLSAEELDDCLGLLEG
jgi:acyl carrier protein